MTQTVSVREDKLYAQRGDRPEDELIPESGDIFFRKGGEGRRLFRRANNGKVHAMIDRRNNEDVVWKKLSSEEPHSFREEREMNGAPSVRR